MLFLTADQGNVFTYMSPVEAFATGIKIFDRQEIVLDHLIVPKKLLIVDFFAGQRSDPLIFAVRR